MIGHGEGGELYRPLAIAIIGGTLTTTLVTLPVVPTFCDRIKITRDRAIAKFHRRATRRNPFVAILLTLVEAILALLLLRWGYRAANTLLIGVAQRRGRN